MNTDISKNFPIMGIEHDCILSKQGDMTVVFKVTLPEIFTLSDSDYEQLHQAWVKAIKVLPGHSVLHKQDWFVRDHYQVHTKNASSFLANASQRHFTGRGFLNHECYILITKKPKGRKVSSSLFSNLLRPHLVPVDGIEPKYLDAFLASVQQFKTILEENKLIQLERVTANDLQSSHSKTGLIERYCFLNEKKDAPLFGDLQFNNDVQIGEQQVKLYTLGDAADLPHYCGSRITYDALSTDKTKFPISFAAPLGLLLSCNHIYNQYIFIGDAQATLKNLERKRLRLQSLSAYSRENTITRDATNDFLNEAITQQRLPVKAHFNIQVWSKDSYELKQLNNQVTAALSQMDASVKLETVGAPQLWWSGIPGNAADFPMNDSFDTFAEQACCFLNLESSYRSDSPSTGIRFCDRLNGKPVYVDLFDEPRKKGWTSNMGMLVCGTSGGGKSMTVNHILSSLYQQGAHCVTVDIGGSYKGLCELVNGYYFTYTEENPIRFNPFYLPKGEALDTEKKESLKALLAALWKQENDAFNRSEYVALSNALQGYYALLKENSTIFPCFNTFYEYLKEDYSELLKVQKVKEKDFDLDNFLYKTVARKKG